MTGVLEKDLISLQSLNPSPSGKFISNMARSKTFKYG